MTSNICRFLLNLFFISAIVVLIITVGFFSTVDQTSVTYALRHKHQLLQEFDKPRIVFVGGSNIRYSLVSPMVKDSLNINPINTGIFAGFGLKFIIDDIKPYLKKGDMVVLATEYHQFYGKSMWGNDQLAQAINICPENIRFMNWQQIITLIRTIPRTNLGKIKATVKHAIFNVGPDIKPYERFDGINYYGDTYVHWSEPSQYWVPDTLSGNFNKDALRIIEELNDYVTNTLEGKLLITFPSYPVCGYRINRAAITGVEEALKQQEAPVLGTALDYIFEDSLFFNSSYHLGKEGAVLRTNKLIQDIKEWSVGNADRKNMRE